MANMIDVIEYNQIYFTNPKDVMLTRAKEYDIVPTHAAELEPEYL